MEEMRGDFSSRFLTPKEFEQDVLDNRRGMIFRNSGHLVVFYDPNSVSLRDIRNTLEVISETGNRDVALLHCVTKYPALPKEINLNVMQTLRSDFDILVGYSDHTAGYHIPLAAVACGARIIEKHISIDFDVPNAQDWKRTLRLIDELQLASKS